MNLLYFAWVRERIGTGAEELSLPDTAATVPALLSWLSTQSDGHKAALADPSRLRIAVNECYVRGDHAVTDADEVAIFPPVTGG